MGNLVRRRFGDEVLTKEEVIRKQVLKENKLESEDLRVGDMFFYKSEHALVRVSGFKIEEWEHHGHKRYDYNVLIEWFDIESRTWYKRTGGYEKLSDYDRHISVKFTGDPNVYFDEALAAIKTGDLSKYQYRQTKSDEENTGLMHVGSKESLEAIKGDLEQAANRVLVIQGFMKLEMDRRKYEIERLKDSLGVQVALMNKQIAKIQKVILTIELFLGVEEHIIQLQEGPTAPSDSPICIRQTIHYMDEEVGDPGEDMQGLEFHNIEDFDAWVVKNGNYKKLLPENKGIMALQIRRHAKDRPELNENPFLRIQMEMQDAYTYLLLRNGDNVYRLGTDKLEFRPRMFPNRKELQNLKDVWDKIDREEEKYKSKPQKYSFDPKLTDRQKEQLEESSIHSKWSSFEFGESKEKIDAAIQNYKMKFVVLQGLIMRTPIFLPLSKPIQFFSAKAQDDDLVRLIFDDELTLPTGRLSFFDWLDQLNSKIHEGSRIVLGWTYSGRGRAREGKHRDFDRPGRFDDRYKERYSPGSYGGHTWSNTPKEPGNGLYYLSSTIRTASKHRAATKEEEKRGDFGFTRREDGKDVRYVHYSEDDKFLCIKYNPGGEVINYWDRYDTGHERKNNVSYLIFPEDQFIINYDDVDLEDVNFYLESRIDRRHYLHIMPLLWQVKLEKEKEYEQEKDFVRLVIGEMIKRYGDKVSTSDVLKRRHVWDAIDWWKAKKVKWKRPIKQDEAKALRMIIKYLSKQLKLSV